MIIVLLWFVYRYLHLLGKWQTFAMFKAGRTRVGLCIVHFLVIRATGVYLKIDIQGKFLGTKTCDQTIHWLTCVMSPAPPPPPPSPPPYIQGPLMAATGSDPDWTDPLSHTGRPAAGPQPAYTGGSVLLGRAKIRSRSLSTAIPGDCYKLIRY